MTTNASVRSQNQLASIDIKFDIELILGVYTIGSKDSPSRASVPVGRIAVVSHDGEAFDQDNLPEVYLAGEVITKNRFRKNAKCTIVELAEYPGTVSVGVTQWLAGLSLTTADPASAKFLYHIRLENPIRLLSREAKWMVADGQNRLKTAVEDLIRDELNSVLNDNIQLWSHPDIREVSGSIFARLDAKLKAWGLRLDSDVPAYRVYPPLLYEVTLQFRTAESDLLDAEEAARQSLLMKLGLQRDDIIGIRNIRDQKGGGAGLLIAAKNRKKDIERFIEWLASDEEAALAAANFLRELYSGNYTARDIELTEQVVFWALRNPMLGLGEWGDTEHALSEVFSHHQLGGI
ncbi:MAG: hypothetical protein FJ005_08680 [Chloroflexi bacterium]|nr:hypothetical protein [Chloroflexota bacterium]